MSQRGVYSDLKPVWWFARDGRLPDAPKQVQLILSDLCNQSCGFCAYRMDGYTSNELFMGDSKPAKYGHSNPVRWIPTDRALSLLDEFKEAGVLAVQFTGGGEPTVHPDHEKIFRKTLDVGLRASLVSNGVRWSVGLIAEVLPRFDWVRVSIDAATPESYAAIRRTPEAHWDLVWSHVQQLAVSIRLQKTDTVFGLGFVVTPTSYQEIYEFAVLARAAGAHNVRFTAMFSPEDEKPFLPIYDEALELLAQAKELNSPAFTVHDNFGTRFADLRQHAPDYPFCTYQYYTTYIGGDLNLYRCCVLAYNKRGLVKGGNLKDRSFAEFWQSQGRKDDLAALDPRGCERCQFNDKNRAALYVMGNTASDASPRHMEWT